jgi:hypothetical protein
MAIELQAPVLECPTCDAQVYKLKYRSERSCRQDAPIVETVASNLPISVCMVGATTTVVNSVERCVSEISICAEAHVELMPGMMIMCNGTAYRITEVTGACGPEVLPTYKAVLDNSTLLEESLDLQTSGS